MSETISEKKGIKATLEMLKKYNSDIYVTKECGQVMIRYTKDKFYVKTL